MKDGIKTFKSFPAAAREYFGFKEGQALGEFMAEIKELSPTDREQLAKGMEENGVVIQP